MSGIYNDRKTLEVLLTSSIYFPEPHFGCVFVPIVGVVPLSFLPFLFHEASIFRYQGHSPLPPSPPTVNMWESAQQPGATPVWAGKSSHDNEIDPGWHSQARPSLRTMVTDDHGLHHGKSRETLWCATSLEKELVLNESALWKWDSGGFSWNHEWHRVFSP